MIGKPIWAGCLAAMVLGFAFSCFAFMALADNIVQEIAAILLGIASCICPPAVAFTINKLFSEE